MAANVQPTKNKSKIAEIGTLQCCLILAAVRLAAVVLVVGVESLASTPVLQYAEPLPEDAAALHAGEPADHRWMYPARPRLPPNLQDGSLLPPWLAPSTAAILSCQFGTRRPLPRRHQVLILVCRLRPSRALVVSRAHGGSSSSLQQAENKWIWSRTVGSFLRGLPFGRFGKQIDWEEDGHGRKCTSIFIEGALCIIAINCFSTAIASIGCASIGSGREGAREHVRC